MIWSLLVLLLSLAAVCGFGALPQDTYDGEFLMGDDTTELGVEGVDDFKDAWRKRDPREVCPSPTNPSVCYKEICIPGTNTCKMPNPRKDNFDNEGNANIGYFKNGVWTARPIMAISNHNQCENLEKLDHCLDALKKPTFIGEYKCESLGEKLCGSGNDAYRQSGQYGFELCGWDKYDGKCRSCGLAFKCHPFCRQDAGQNSSIYMDWPSPPPPPSPSPPPPSPSPPVGRRLEDETDAEHRRKMRDLYNQQVTSRMRKLAAACDVNKPNCKLPPGAGFGQCDACPAELSTTQSTSWDAITNNREKLTEKDYKCAPGISGMYINTTVNKGSQEDCDDKEKANGQCLPVGNFRIETISCDLGYAKYDMEKNTCPGNSKAFNSSGHVVATGDFCDLKFVKPDELAGESVTSEKVKAHIRKNLPSLEAGTVDPTPEEIADVEYGLGIPGRWMLTVKTVQFGNTSDTLRDIYVPSKWSQYHFGKGYDTFHPTEGPHNGGGGCKCTTSYTPDAMDVAYGRSFANPGNSRNALTQSKSCKAQYTASVNPRLAPSLDTVKINGISYVDCFSARDAETLEKEAGLPAGRFSGPSQDLETRAGGKPRTSADATAECMPDAENDITLMSRTIATTRGNLRMSKMTCNLQIQVKSEDGRVGRIDREQDGDCLCSPPTTTEALNRGRSSDGDIIAKCMETEPKMFAAEPDNEVVVTNKVVSGDMAFVETEEITATDTSESALCEKLDEMKDLTALHPATPYCNKYGSASKEECESYFFTGTSGHIYPCKYDAAKVNKKGKSTPCTWVPDDQTLCCSHFCQALKSKTNLNPDNVGGKPWCGKTSETSPYVCESHYWTGGDLRSYSCLFDTTRQAAGKAPCRLSLGNACACDSEPVEDPDSPIDLQKSWLDSDY